MILNPPTDNIFQISLSLMIIDVYVNSFSGVKFPLHGCWLGPSHLYNVQSSLDSAFEYVF